jgi:hypothetical protein
VTSTNGENRVRSYEVTKLFNERVDRTATDASGLMVLSSRSGTGVTSTLAPGGVQITSAETADPRFGMQSPLEHPHSSGLTT